MSEQPDPIAIAAQATNPEGVKPPGKFRRFVVAAGALLALTGCDVDQLSTEPVGSDEPTQQQVWSAEAGGIAGGLEGDGNGLFNTRDAVTPEEGEYEKDGILDALPGLPNLVIGTADTDDPKADEAPKGDGSYIEHEDKEGKSPTEESGTVPLKVRLPFATTRTVEDGVTVEAGTQGETQYERDFITDRRTFEQAAVPAAKVADDVLKLIEDGYTIRSVKITGTASGEDHTKPGDEQANIGQPSENNQELARERTTHGVDAIGAAFTERGINSADASMEIEALEVEPTPEQTQKLQEAADALGITVFELTERYNTGLGEFSPETQELLFETLTKNRGVMYEVYATKDSTVAAVEFRETVIKLPLDVIKRIAGNNPEQESVFRIEIPGEILLLFLLWGMRNIPLPTFPPGGVRPRTPRTPYRPPVPTGPRPPLPRVPGTPGLPPIPVVSVPGVGPPPPPPPVDPPPRPRYRLERGSFGKDQVMYGSVASHDKRPREFNMGKGPGRMAGGAGKRSRDRGAGASGRRSKF